MRTIINDTEVIAFDYLKAFGFDEEQINMLIAQGKKDLEINLENLNLLLQKDTISTEDVSNALHALKGLLFQLGNHKIAEKLNESRSDLENRETLKEIEELLFPKD